MEPFSGTDFVESFTESVQTRRWGYTDVEFDTKVPLARGGVVLGKGDQGQQ